MKDPRILGPIPTPPAQRWKEIRLIFLPRAVFVLAAIIVGILWSQSVAPASLVAEAEVIGADVRSTQAGYVAELKVGLLQPVKAGEVIGHISAVNPRLLDATLAVIRAEVGMLNDTMAGATDKQRAAQTFERIQLDALRARVDLVSIKARLQQADSDLARYEPLHKSGLVSDQDFEQRTRDRDSLRDQVQDEEKLAAHYEEIQRRSLPTDALSTESALEAAIKLQDAKLKLAETQLTPQPLVAPIDGVVSLLARHVGEAVSAGDVVLHVNSPQAHHLIGYLRPPLSIDPKVGMAATVRTRSGKRIEATTKVVGVGPAMEAIPNGFLAAMHVSTSQPPEHALQVRLAMPAGFNVRPGEHVDVTLH